jgi:3-hydroxyacyl-[acyl-carrier-protein] dehydratase
MEQQINIREILNILPHRYPFVLVDKIVELEIGKSIVGIKNVTFNEPHFMGHFPGNPVMPGVLIIEAMAQVAAILTAKSVEVAGASATPFLVGVDNARFRKMVVPGDTLELRATILQNKRGIWIIEAVTKVDGAIAAQANLMATLKMNDQLHG